MLPVRATVDRAPEAIVVQIALDLARVGAVRAGSVRNRGEEMARSVRGIDRDTRDRRQVEVGTFGGPGVPEVGRDEQSLAVVGVAGIVALAGTGVDRRRARWIDRDRADRLGHRG